MNSKLLKASLAGVAAIALAAGGTTFASWTDFATVEGNNVGAGVLKLQLNANDTNPGTDWKFDNLKLAPGQYYERQVYVATNSATSTPDARLFVDVENLLGKEDGCSTSSEAFEESKGKISDAGNRKAPCNFPNGVGQLLDQALLKVGSYVPTGTTCNQGNDDGRHVIITHEWLLKDALANLPLQLTGSANTKPEFQRPFLKPGQGLCVAITVELPDRGEVNNMAQGDTASFDLRFTVEQASFSFGDNQDFFQ